MADYAQRREVALGRLRELVAARQRWDDRKYQDMQANEQRLKDEAYQQERADNKNWLDEAASGARMGAAAGGPWGALVGGIAGTGMGMKKAYDQRREEGQSGWDSATRTAFDTPGGSLKLNKGNMGDMAQAYGSSKAYNDQEKARKSGLQEAKWESKGFGSDWAARGNALNPGQQGGTYDPGYTSSSQNIDIEGGSKGYAASMPNYGQGDQTVPDAWSEDEETPVYYGPRKKTSSYDPYGGR